MTRPRVPRAQSKEAYRLWFEFLRRAIAEDRSKVKLALYKEWGDVESHKFDKWWDEIGGKVIQLRSIAVESVARGEADDASYLLRVPKSETSTQIGEQVRRFLIGIGHQPIARSRLRVKEGAQIRPSTYRAYLHTYDQQRKLQAAANGRKPTAKEVLKAVRRFYLERERRYQKNFRKFDKLPTPLAVAMNRGNLDDVNALAVQTAILAIHRYLREANAIIDAVRQGRFPR